MSERLSKYGREGSEELAKIINSFFARLIDIIKSFKGDIYGFGGDAIFAFFKGNDKERRALESAISMINFVDRNKSIRKFNHVFKVGMHVGVVTGKIFFKDLGTGSFMGGKTLRKLAHIVSETKSGEIAVCAQTYKRLREYDFSRRGRYYFLNKLKKIKLPEYKDAMEKYSERIIMEIKNYIPDFIIEKLKLKPYFEPEDGEHKKVTGVFFYIGGIDFDGNPRLSERRIKTFYDVLREKCNIFGGYINKFDIADKGERVFVTFGFPKAMEDDEVRAVAFCYELLSDRRLKNISLRAGVNSGYVFAGPVGSDKRSEFTIMGDAVNLAARLASKAKPGEILITLSLKRKIANLFETKRKGRLKVKGKRKDIELFKLVAKKKLKIKEIEKWVSESSVMVGRDREMSRTRDLLKKVSSKRGQIFFVTGEAGIGKSRLTREIVKFCIERKFKVMKVVVYPMALHSLTTHGPRY